MVGAPEAKNNDDLGALDRAPIWYLGPFDSMQAQFSMRFSHLMGMALLALIAVLLIEQVRPLPYRRFVLQPLDRLAWRFEAVFNAGEHQHGIAAWIVGVGGLVLVVGGVHAALAALSPLLSWLWSVGVLYLTLGFRQFSHHFTDIQFALRMDDLRGARRELDAWRAGTGSEGLSAADIARIAIEEALVASHRHVFAVLLCFILLPGPCGAVLYRAAACFADSWGRREQETESFGVFSRQAFAVIDWLPARATAAVFAIVGNFEDAVYCWRNQVGRWANSPWGAGAGVVLASGAGALGVRLGVCAGAEGDEAAELGVGEPADVDFMQGAVGLVWRALLLWLSLMLLMTFAGLVGG